MSGFKKEDLYKFKEAFNIFDIRQTGNINKEDLPSLLAIGGTLAGILLALLSRIFVEVAAQGKAARARNVLEKSIGRVAQSQIAQPVNSELGRYDDARAAIARAR